MILYVNGDSHTAGAELVNDHAFAEDDAAYGHLGRQPHPDNLVHSWCNLLANKLNYELVCDAESASSNQRIIRTTKDYLGKNSQRLDQIFVILQWSTWERQEWYWQDQWFQVNASGIDVVPKDLQSKYKQFVSQINWRACTEQAHADIWQFHCELEDQNIKHVMFNGNSHFGSIRHLQHWQDCYISPYLAEETFDAVLKNNGFTTVRPNSWHFGMAAHCFWADYMLTYLNNNSLV